MRLHPPLTVRNALRHLWLAPRKGILLLLEAYQHTLSPDHGPLKTLHPFGYCRHEPSCSQYAKQIIAKRGILRGLPRIVGRLVSCHPWAKVREEKMRSVCARLEDLIVNR